MAEHPMYGGGSCAVCDAPIRRGLLMCRPHWRRVSLPARSAVLATLRAWERNEVVLGDVWEAQDEAVAEARAAA